jgi:hypothetical protein
VKSGPQRSMNTEPSCSATTVWRAENMALSIPGQEQSVETVVEYRVPPTSSTIRDVEGKLSIPSRDCDALGFLGEPPDVGIMSTSCDCSVLGFFGDPAPRNSMGYTRWTCLLFARAPSFTLCPATPLGRCETSRRRYRLVHTH